MTIDRLLWRLGHRLRLLFSFSLLGVLCGMASVRSAELWVSVDGNDSYAGSRAQPVASVGEAQRRARELRRRKDPSAEAGVTVWVKGGVYPLTGPLLFRPEDSGTEISPTLIAAAPGEHPVLSGGVVVQGWKKAGEIAGLPEIAKGKVWVAEGPVVANRVLEFRQLWVGERKAVRARTPNVGEMSHLLEWNRKTEEAVIQADLAASLSATAACEMVVQQQWEIAILRLKNRRTEGTRATVTFHAPESKLEFEHPWPQPILPPNGSGAFYLVGALEFLDQPGEWYQESRTGRVFYWPRDGEDLTRDVVIAPALETLVEIDGSLDRPVANLQFKGITFAHTTWLRPSQAGHVPLQASMYLIDGYKISPKGTPDSAGLDNQDWIGRPSSGVRVRGAHHVRFEQCRFEHMAATGLDFIGGSHDDVVEGCVFRDLGGNGLQLGGFQEGGVETHLPYDPKDEREICTHERIANNGVTDCGTEDWGSVGICVGYAREVTIEHNEVFDVPYTGISVGWGWTKSKNCLRDNRIHANRLHHVATRMCDTSGIYILSAQPGTVVSENLVDGITMSPYVDLPDHWFYLYLDEGSSFITVRDNYCTEAKFLKNANGPGNIWENNGPMVSDKIKEAAGLEPAFRLLLKADLISKVD